MFEILILMLDATIRTAPPLILAAMAGMFCERSGGVRLGGTGCWDCHLGAVCPDARLCHHHPPR